MLIFAHRGASAVAPENTLAAFDKALEAQADAIELDISQVDGEVYVFHDRYLDRLTAKPGRFQDLSSAQVQTLAVFGQHQVPTLKQALHRIAGRCMLNIEIKAPVEQEKLSELLNYALWQCGFTEQQLLISSFNHHWLKDIKAARPQTRIGALTATNNLDYAAYATQLGAYSAHIDINVIDQAFVHDAHQRGLAVFVYTVDEAQDITWLKKLGVDGIFTNHPLLAKTILAGLPVCEHTLIRHF